MSTVIVTTAIELTAAQRAEVKEVAEKKLGSKKFTLEEVVNPQLIGGIQLVINSKQYDASVKGKLDSLRQTA